MALRKDTPCDLDGVCPFDAIYSSHCEYWCRDDYEPEDYPDDYYYSDDDD